MAPLHHFDNLVRGGEVNPPGQGSLQVRFQELALPTTWILERHVDPMPTALAGHGESIGEEEAKKSTAAGFVLE